MEELIKRKRGRPRKNKLPEEILKLVSEVQSKENTIDKVLDTIHNEKPIKEKLNNSFEWDFPIGSEIPFFDSNLSYEITGYKPINKMQGLDFNPEWFIETRKNYNRTGHYTEYRYGTKAYKTFWDQEYTRCREGMTVNGYTITGDHYYFLNYYQLLNLSSVKKAGTSRLYSFPDFYVAQYEWFHYLELCKRLLKNACLMKARGIGQHTKADYKFRKIGED